MVKRRSTYKIEYFVPSLSYPCKAS